MSVMQASGFVGEAPDKKVKTPTIDDAKNLIGNYRQHYSKILDKSQLEIMNDYVFKMLKEGQTPKDALYWADQFMHQRTTAIIMKDDPIFVKFNLNSDEMIALTRAAYNVVNSDKYFAERAREYDGGALKYVLDSFKGAYQELYHDEIELHGYKIRPDAARNIDLDPKYSKVVGVVEDSVSSYFGNSRHGINQASVLYSKMGYTGE